ncbi:UDP-N-acetylmuramate dehydrogenase [Thalassomonas sp. M1454]|uniref:UDP-N-acetylmuramate dehydrogenase n=1 Tax=Thalassomonas sp. M1454 TaxID=2594477 RepID=UPI00117E5BF3|nr:UDP-N-acetylmuramate dehydrogenase [Thalassomonas sp. M1454]TRX55230.1 UDP-N-acetylmuramate dehydrogenase [Thalassomonas sp. M1454]
MSQASLSLKSLNSFAINAKAQEIVTLTDLAQLEQFTKTLPKQFYILGGGSNSLFINDYQGTIICPDFKGIKLTETSDSYLLDVASGEDWHELVQYCLNNNIAGLENLALIPGNCGAAPIQNIGAYGIEFADVCDYVKWFDFTTGKVQVLSKQDCQFAYRNSIFKGALKNKGLVIAIGIKLNKKWQPLLNYAGLNELGNTPTPKQVFEQVVAIRQAKLPDPKQLPNAGSFFKNPVVNAALFENIKQQYPQLISYPLANGDIKLAAGWLIQECGLKGKTIGGAAVHKLQALVLVNVDNASGEDVIALAKFVQRSVFKKFGVNLEPEVRLIANCGEVLLENL